MTLLLFLLLRTRFSKLSLTAPLLPIGIFPPIPINHDILFSNCASMVEDKFQRIIFKNFSVAFNTILALNNILVLSKGLPLIMEQKEANIFRTVEIQATQLMKLFLKQTGCVISASINMDLIR